MVKKRSFTKYENELLPAFRQKLNMAESTEDVKKFFTYTMQDLFKRVLEQDIDLVYEDITLTPDMEHPVTISDRIRSLDSFQDLQDNSDLPHVIDRMARAALNRHKHLGRNPEKTEAKIRFGS
jgi:glycyl-tRNA synthetase beta subunit